MLGNSISQIKKLGVVSLSQPLSEERCKNIMSFIDDYDSSQSEINFGGSEKRIWDAERSCVEVQEFAEFSDEIVSEAKGKSMKAYTILAYKNAPCDLSKFSLGRWHSDSFFSQLKVFCFLSKVEEENGPLEILMKTHSPSYKALGLLSGKYIRPSDLLKSSSSRSYAKLDEKYIRLLSKFGAKSRKMVTKESGESFLVDSSAIHRASPVLGGERYALCAYYRHN
jgi:hypothetical protein